MNKSILFNIIGNISDDLIAEASDPIKRVRRIRISKAAALAAAIIALLSLTVFASSVIVSRTSTSSNIPSYCNVPSQQTLKNDIGISPKVVESFLNGYRFNAGRIVKNTDFSDDGGPFEKYKSLSCTYERGNYDIYLDIDASKAGIQMNRSEIADVYKNSELRYYTYMNKIVPGSYELTEQDKKDKESGKYVFSFGSEAIEIYEVQVLGWEYGGLNYTFCAIDGDVTKDELVQMAREIIDYQED